MKKENSLNNKLRNILLGSMGILLFIGISFIVQQNLESFQGYLQNYRTLGVFVYILFAIIATVFAPLTSIPLIPIASNLYGWFLTGVYSIIGWFVGSLIAFYISRRYGKAYVEKFVSLKEVKKLEKTVSKKKKFFSLILLRMFLPVDILTYALGLFTNIDFKTFAITTLVGIIPFAFILAYLGYLPIFYQIIGWVILVLVAFIVLKLVSYKSFNR